MSQTGLERSTRSKQHLIFNLGISSDLVSSAAASLVELAEDGDREKNLEEADRLMKLVPKLTKKIAGKSLPIEVS